MAYLFLAASVVLSWAIVVRMPKRLSWSEQYTCALFAVLFNSIIDAFFDLGYDYYGYFNRGPDVQTLILLLGVLPPISMIFLNFYPQERGWPTKVMYLLLWVGISVGYEWLALQSGLLYYRQWSLWYSAAMYPGILILTLVNLSAFRWIERHETHHKVH